MNHPSIIGIVALVAAAILPLSAQDADPLQAPAAKAFGDRQGSTVNLTITRKIQGKDQSFEIPAVSLDGKGLLVASLDGVESGGQGIMADLQIGGSDEEEEGAADEPKAGDKGELTRVAMLRADATEAEADLVITDAALDLALIRVRPGDGGAVVVPPAPPVAKTAPGLLENVLVIERQGPEFQRVASAALLQVAAVITTPRRLFIPSQPLSGGTAVYNLGGEWLGIAATVRDECVIVPADAILKLAASVPAKAEK